jgi:HTH-type transcriptional regulator / antitoxin HipB
MLSKSMRTDGTSSAATPMQQLGRALRARRRALKLNQAELAQLSGVGLAFLYDLEHGKATVRIDKLLAVLAVLGLELQLREGKQTLSLARELDEGAR